MNSLYYCIYTFFIISFAQYREYIICLVSFSRSSDVLPAFIYENDIGKFWSICLGVDIFSRVVKSKGHPFPYIAFIGNIPLLKALWVNSRPS